jgi:hypothetical protein
VIASHVVAMFAPSFFTGSLIKRFGVLQVILAGVACSVACVGLRALRAGGRELLVGAGAARHRLELHLHRRHDAAHRERIVPSEKAKAQGANEITVFGVQALSSLVLGVLVNTAGWATHQLRRARDGVCAGRRALAGCSQRAA